MSDARIVKKVRAINRSMERILKLVPVEFKWKDSDPEFTADFIAQDFAKVFPQFVSRARANDNGTSPIPPAEENQVVGRKGWFISRLDVLIPWIVAAIQELNGEVDQVKKRANKKYQELDAKVTALEARLAALEASSAQNSATFLQITDELTALDKRIDSLEAP